MKVFQLHVGNKVIKPSSAPNELYLQRLSFEEDKKCYYLKHDIANADSQMQSLMKKGVAIEYGHFSDRKSLRSLYHAGKRLRKICKEKQIGLVHVFWGTTTALTAVLFSPVPVIISFSGSDLIGNVGPDGRINWSGRISKLLSRISALFAVKMIVKSSHMRNLLWPFTRRKAVIIPNGVDLSAFKPMEQSTAKKLLGWNKNEKIILFFNGSGAIVKDQPLAEKVFGEVKRQHADVTLKIISNVPHEQLVYYYNAADVMLLTSFHEGSNNSLKEARACNLPIVSVDVGDAKERLQQVGNSFVVDSRDPKKIAEKVLKVLKSNKRSDGAKYSGDVSMDYVAKSIIKVYDSLKL